MMQQNTVKVEDARLSVPDGGIASFVPDDDEMEDEEDDAEEYGSDGIAQFPALSKRMAAMGRNGDTVVGHLTPGEIVIPKALIDQDPALREGLFQRLRDMGVEDPEQYVVGSESNSINPDTGMPEFFLKKLFRAIKKVVKKVASVVLPIALAFTPLGPIYGAAVGSGVATLINGGSFKDALKSAAVGGLTAGVFQGFTGGQGSFGANVQAGLADPLGRVSQTVSGLGSTVTGGGFTGPGNLFTPYAAPGAAAVPGAELPAQGAPDAAPAGGGSSSVTTGQAAETAVGPGTFGENLKDAFMPGGKSFGEAMGDAFFPKPTVTVGGTTLVNPTASQVLTAGGVNPMTATGAQYAAASNLIKEAAPGFLRTYGPMAAVGTAVAAGAGMFKPVPAEPAGVVQRDAEGNAVTGSDLIAQNPGQYLVSDLGSRVLDTQTGLYQTRPIGGIGDLSPTYQMPTTYSVPTTFPTNTPAPYLRQSNPGGPFARPYVVQAAEGGAIFPRRNGGIMPDEGVPGKDSVRAMLMPGEFVMTTNAVRGAGNGDVKNGIRNMYSMMRNLEARGKAMA